MCSLYVRNHNCLVLPSDTDIKWGERKLYKFCLLHEKSEWCIIDPINLWIIWTLQIGTLMQRIFLTLVLTKHIWWKKITYTFEFWSWASVIGWIIMVKYLSQIGFSILENTQTTKSKYVSLTYWPYNIFHIKFTTLL